VKREPNTHPEAFDISPVHKAAICPSRGDQPQTLDTGFTLMNSFPNVRSSMVAIAAPEDKEASHRSWVFHNDHHGAARSEPHRIFVRL